LRRLAVLVLMAAALLSGCARPPAAPVGSPAHSVAASSPVGSVPGTVSVPAGQGRITVGGLDIAFSASAQAPALPPRLSSTAPAQPPRLAPKHRWLAIGVVATNSTDATVDVPTHQNDPVLTDSTGTRVVPYVGTSTPAAPWVPEGLGPGGVFRVSMWYQVPLHGGPFSVTWTAGSGQPVVFHAP